MTSFSSWVQNPVVEIAQSVMFIRGQSNERVLQCRPVLGSVGVSSSKSLGAGANLATVYEEYISRQTVDLLTQWTV